MTSFAEVPQAGETPSQGAPGARFFLGGLAVTALSSVVGGAIGVSPRFLEVRSWFSLQEGLGGGCLWGLAMVALYCFARPPRPSLRARYSESVDLEQVLSESSLRPFLLFASAGGILLATFVGGAIGLGAGYIEGELWTPWPEATAAEVDAIYGLRLIRSAGNGLAAGCGAGVALVGMLLWQRSR